MTCVRRLTAYNVPQIRISRKYEKVKNVNVCAEIVYESRAHDSASL